MDEVLFRSSQKLENLQVQISLATSQSKDLFQQYSQRSKSLLIEAWNSSYAIHIKNKVHQIGHYVISLGHKIQKRIWFYVDPQKLYYNLAQVFWQRWSKRDVCFLAAGFICGSIVGGIIALSIRRRNSVIHYMQAIQCTNYLGIESATVIENAVAPHDCGNNEVMVSVKAASVQIIDAQICSGYGKTLRRILQRLYGSKHHVPVTLGRDCTGSVIDVGENVKRLEIGDEVWLAVPFWFEGTFSQTVVVPEFRVSRKPKNVGFEGACSLPYAGCVALNALREAGISSENASNKRVLILGGCTPIGCVLIQILKHWRANITTTSFGRAVPVVKALGVSDIIAFSDPAEIDGKILSSPEFSEEEINVVLKELELRSKFDRIIVTRDYNSIINNLKPLCDGKIVSTLPKKLASDYCGFFGNVILEGYLCVKYLIEKLTGIGLNDFDEAHLCYITLDELTEMVENGYLQTVVDKIFHPQDIEIALSHIQSLKSIGSTVITFR